MAEGASHVDLSSTGSCGGPSTSTSSWWPTPTRKRETPSSRVSPPGTRTRGGRHCSQSRKARPTSLSVRRPASTMWKGTSPTADRPRGLAALTTSSRRAYGRGHGKRAPCPQGMNRPAEEGSRPSLPNRWRTATLHGTAYTVDEPTPTPPVTTRGTVLAAVGEGWQTGPRGTGQVGPA